MRIGLLVHQFPSREHPYIFDWVAKLIEQGVDLTILTEQLAPLPATGFWASRRGVAQYVRRINALEDFSAALFLRSLMLALRFPRRFVQLFRVLRAEKLLTRLRKLVEYLPLLGENFDLIHFNAPQTAVRRFELKDFFVARSLVSFRGQDFTFHPDRYDRLLQEADHLHFIAEFLLWQARERGYDGENYTIIPPMVDTDFYKPADVKKEAQRLWTLFTAARLEWVKGWEFGLQAVALLLERGYDVDYYIAGEGSFKDAILYTIDQLGIGEHVHLLGWQSPEQVRDWMQKSDVYLMPSVSEAFNNSVLQAQACGLPVVCSDEGGLPENIEDGVTGLLFRRRDAWDMAEKMEMCLTNTQKLAEIGDAGVQRVKEKFLLPMNAERFSKMYLLEVGSP